MGKPDANNLAERPVQTARYQMHNIRDRHEHFLRRSWMEPMDSNVSIIEQEVLGWPGVISAPGRFDALAFRYGKREIGHIHRDQMADPPVTPDVREELLSEGRARPHRAGVKGYISYPIRSPEDASVVIDILGWNYDRAKAAAERRAARQQGTEE